MSYTAVAKEYSQQIVRGEIPAGHFMRRAARRFLDDLKRARKRSCSFRYDENEADKACKFIEMMPHVEGTWDHDTLVLEPWQVWIVCNVFGFRKRSDGTRRFTSVYVEVARKNGKSAFTAAVMLYAFLCEGENGPQVKTAATTYNQAKIVFGVAKRMVERLPQLQEALDVKAWAKKLTSAMNGGEFEAIHAKASTQDGLNPHAYSLDELHAHKDRDLFDVLRSAQGARSNPLRWYITTAGYNLLGVCYEQRQLVSRILDGAVGADHYFAAVYTLDVAQEEGEEGDDPFDENVWIKANPNLGVSVSMDDMRGYAVEALASPDAEAEFKTKRCNIWLAARATWLSVKSWAKGFAPPTEEGRITPIFGGLDLAAVSDFNAFAEAWRNRGGRIQARLHYFLPKDTVEPRTERSGLPYQKWIEEGSNITVTEGNVADYAVIEERMVDCHRKNGYQGIGYDPWGATDLVNRLVDEGLPMERFVQGFKSFNAPCKELARAVTGEFLDHGGDPVLAWMASNVVAATDINESIKPDRKSSAEKIDGIVALLMAIGLLLAYEEKAGISDFLEDPIAL